MNRKIGILTYFWADNPGTFLQAYAMLRAFSERFPRSRVEIINCRHRRAKFRLGIGHVNPFRLWKDYRRYRIYRSIRASNLTMSREEIITDDYDRAAAFIERQGYDLVVVGADTVLQMISGYARRGQPPIYWLPAEMKCRKVIFSASSNLLTYEQLDQNMRSRLHESLNGFDLVGVRDDGTYALVEALGLSDSSRLEMTPDPTFPLEVDTSPAKRRLGRKFDLARPIAGINLRGEIGDRLAEHYRAKGFQILSLKFAEYADWSPVAISPFEWAGVYPFLSLMITDRFHGAVFSLKSGIPVVNVDYAAGSMGMSKRYCILKQFGLGSCHVELGAADDVGCIVAAAENAVENFDRQSLQQKVTLMSDKFHAFREKVAGLIE